MIQHGNLLREFKAGRFAALGMSCGSQVNPALAAFPSSGVLMATVKIHFTLFPPVRVPHEATGLTEKGGQKKKTFPAFDYFSAPFFLSASFGTCTGRTFLIRMWEAAKSKGWLRLQPARVSVASRRRSRELVNNTFASES